MAAAISALIAQFCAPLGCRTIGVRAASAIGVA